MRATSMSVSLWEMSRKKQCKRGNCMSQQDSCRWSLVMMFLSPQLPSGERLVEDEGGTNNLFMLNDIFDIIMFT